MRLKIIYIAIALLIAIQLLLVLSLIKEANYKLNEISDGVDKINNYCLEE